MPMVRVRALRDNITTFKATLMKGDVGECPDDRAKMLRGRGDVEILDGESDSPVTGTAQAAKGDRAERATSRAAATAEHQTKKG